MVGELPKSPLAPKRLAELPEINGVKLRSGKCGIKKNGKTDFFIAEFDDGTSVAGVFTKSKTRSAAVDWCRESLKTKRARAFIANAGNSNAFTGNLGKASVEKYVAMIAENLGCKTNEIYVASTGVIGVPMPPELIIDNFEKIYNEGKTTWEAAAEAFSTTDTFIKVATRKAKIGVQEITINGIAKGSGMIAPDMATMLCFVATDASITSGKLQEILLSANEKSFNSITVDSDTSTSDTLLVFATNKIPTNGDLKDFTAKLEDLLLDLAHQVVKDGEGATKFIKVEVSGAENNSAAKKVALSIANSPLVKTAIAGEDANWGRIVMAVGKSGEEADRDRLTIKIGEYILAEDGQIAKDYNEAPVAKYMKGQNIDIFVDIGIANGAATIWTCDLTHQYISINADYRS